MSYFGLLARSLAAAILIYNEIICVCIILCIITKYIVYNNIAQLSTHASIVSTRVGFERYVKCFIENAKITDIWLTS